MVECNAIFPTKLAILLTLGSLSVGFGCLPIGLKWLLTRREVHLHPRRSKLFARLTNFLLSFGGGVLMFTSFVHLHPEVRLTFADLERRGIYGNAVGGVDTSELLICGGFFLVYLLEVAMHYVIDRSAEVDPSEVKDEVETVCAKMMRDPSVGSLEKAEDCAHHHHHVHHHEYINVLEADNWNMLMRSLIAIFALSIHAVFEGLALGLEDNVATVWYLFLAIATHKFVIILCIGFDLVAAKLRSLAIFVYVLVFSVVTPCGIFLGTFLCTDAAHPGDSLLLLSAFLQAIAAGTLLYVIFFEILLRERDAHGRDFGQILAILSGFVFMLVMHSLITSGHSHNHTYNDNHNHIADQSYKTNNQLPPETLQ